MKNRLVCLFLCLVLLLVPVLSSCSSNEENVEENISADASESAMTLSLYLVSEASVSASALAAVSEQVNAITNAKYKTKVVMKYLSREEYRATLESTIQKYAANVKEEDLEQPENAAPQQDETEINEYGMSVIKYPELESNQVDIFYLFGKDFLHDFAERKWLYQLDSELNGASGTISSYTSPKLLSAIREGSATYAIPNNHTIGSYTYLLLDKELMDQCGFNKSIGLIDGFYNRDLYSWLYFAKKGTSAVAIDSDVIGSDISAYELCQNLLAQYWGVDEDLAMTGEFSVFGHAYDDGEVLDRGQTLLTWENLFADETFTEHYLKLREMKSDGYFEEAGDGKALLRFAVGDANLLEEYNARLPGLSEKEYEGAEYYAIPILNPIATEEDVYSNMFAVCRYSKSPSRSMQIVTLINTDEAFRNLLQYGVEGQHYKKLSDNQIQITSSDYQMDLSATGNEFLAYLTPDLPENIWENGKTQNRDASVSPLLGFDLTEQAEGKTIATELVSRLHALDLALTAKLNACTKAADLEALAGEIAKLLDPNDSSEASDFTLLKDLIQSSVIGGDLDALREDLKNAYSTSAMVTEEDALLETPNSLYYGWASANGYLPK